MSEETTIVARRLSDGRLVQVLPGGSTRPLPDRTDWERVRAMTDEEVEAAARTDPDTIPLSVEERARMQRLPRVKVIRQALGMTQEEFASKFHLSISSVRDWEQGRVVPDQAARSYLHVIARNPEAVLQAFEPSASAPAFGS